MKTAGILNGLIFLVVVASTSGVVIKCHYTLWTWWEFGILYSCRPATVTTVTTPETITGVTGNHLIFMNYASVKEFNVDGHKTLTEIPKGIEKYFSNLIVFRWTNGNIATINASTFNQLTKLKHISLSYNKLVTIDGDLFKYTRNLQYVHFYYNLLQHIKPNLLTGLINLVVANFESNQCINLLADTTQAVKLLNLLLPFQCPLLTTPEPSECSEPGPDPVQDTCPNDEEVEEKQKRIDELEMQLRESHPCSR